MQRWSSSAALKGEPLTSIRVLHDSGRRSLAHLAGTHEHRDCSWHGFRTNHAGAATACELVQAAGEGTVRGAWQRTRSLLEEAHSSYEGRSAQAYDRAFFQT